MSDFCKSQLPAICSSQRCGLFPKCSFVQVPQIRQQLKEMRIWTATTDRQMCSCRAPSGRQSPKQSGPFRQTLSSRQSLCPSWPVQLLTKIIPRSQSASEGRKQLLDIEQAASGTVSNETINDQFGMLDCNKFMSVNYATCMQSNLAREWQLGLE